MGAHASASIIHTIFVITFSLLFSFPVQALETIHPDCSSKTVQRNVYFKCKPSTAEYGDSATRKYVRTLDLWIVSHGAVGSNNLIEYLENRTQLKLRGELYKYQVSCHYPHILRGLNHKTRVLYIAGNIQRVGLNES